MEALSPTAERLAKDDWLTIKTEQAGVTTVQVKTPHALEMYWQRGQLGEQRRYDAGCRLRDAWEHANLEPSIICRYNAKLAGDGGSALDHKRGAYEAWKRAMRAVGPIASNEVTDVCCFGLTLQSRERLEILRRGLDVLADHYGLA
jgi:hypothetical protein